MKSKLTELEQQAVKIRRLLEQGYGYTSKPLSKGRIKRMRLLLAKIEEDILTRSTE
jgi:hypothetical protein